MGKAIVKVLKTSFFNAINVHVYWLQRGEGWMRLVIGILLSYVWVFYIYHYYSLWFTISLSLTLLNAIFAGWIYRTRAAVLIIVFGVFLAYAALEALIESWALLKNGEILYALLAIIFAVILFVLGFICKLVPIAED